MSDFWQFYLPACIVIVYPALSRAGPISCRLDVRILLLFSSLLGIYAYGLSRYSSQPFVWLLPSLLSPFVLMIPLVFIIFLSCVGAMLSVGRDGFADVLSLLC